MTQRRRIVPEGYVDEAVIEKLMSSFDAVVGECLPTATEIVNAGIRIIGLGLHVRFTNGNPAAITPETQAVILKLERQICDLLDGTTARARSEDAADDLDVRQYAAQMAMLHILRDHNLVEVPDLCPVVAAITAAMLLRVPPELRPGVAEKLDGQIAYFLAAPPAGTVPDHDA